MGRRFSLEQVLWTRLKGYWGYWEGQRKVILRLFNRNWQRIFLEISSLDRKRAWGNSFQKQMTLPLTWSKNAFNSTPANVPQSRSFCTTHTCPSFHLQKKNTLAIESLKLALTIIRSSASKSTERHCIWILLRRSKNKGRNGKPSIFSL